MDYDTAFANADFIPDGASYPARWAIAAKEFRYGHDLKELGVRYGAAARQNYDLYHPAKLSRGTIVFVHGGFWKAFSPQDFSYLAKGAVEAGYTFAMPGYTLAPDARISEITQQIHSALTHISHRTQGPLILCGHSAGGHLVARMACNDQSADWTGRISKILPISPVSDLVPLQQTKMNEILNIDQEEAELESVVRYSPADIPVHVWVGAAERPIFVEQAEELATAWGCPITKEPERHHFDVIDGLTDPNSELMKVLLPES